MTARNHHFVSQCYLKGFAADRQKPALYVVDGKTGKAFTTNPLNIAAQRDFHRVNIEGVPVDAVETALSKFEDEVGPALKRIIAARSVANVDDLSYVLALMALFAARNPARRENWRQFEERVLKRVLELATATPERWASQVRQAGLGKMPGGQLPYEKIRDFVERDEFDIKLATEHHLKLEFASWTTLVDVLARRNWVLLRAPQGATGFVTSDHPVCLSWTDPTRRGFHGPGFGLTNTEVIFPVSNELALAGRFEGRSGQIDVSDRLLAHINTNIMMYAQRQTYARADDFRYVSASDGEIRTGADLPNDPAFSGSKREVAVDEP